MGTQHSMLPLLAVTGMMLAGCSEKRPQSAPPAAADSTSSNDMVDITWEWVRLTTPVEQMDIDAPDHYTIRFGSDGKVALRADCNRGMGRYSVTADRKLALKPIALSRAMCPKGSLSDRFAREVGRATSWFLKDGDLFLELPVDSGTLRFRRQTTSGPQST